MTWSEQNLKKLGRLSSQSSSGRLLLRAQPVESTPNLLRMLPLRYDTLPTFQELLIIRHQRKLLTLKRGPCQVFRRIRVEQLHLDPKTMMLQKVQNHRPRGPHKHRERRRPILGPHSGCIFQHHTEHYIGRNLSATFENYNSKETINEAEYLLKATLFLVA